MSYEYFSLVLILSIILLSLSIWRIVRYAIHKHEIHCQNVVKNTSQRYQDIKHINQEYNFHDISETIVLSVYVKSKQKFDNFSYDDYLRENVRENLSKYEKLIYDLSENNKMFSSYLNHISNASPFADVKSVEGYGISFVDYKKHEEELVSGIILDPVKDGNIKISLHYRSPKGRNNYYTEKIFPYSVLQEYCMLIRIRQKREQEQNVEIQKERSIMTSAMRYKIMKRDHFRCVLCGRSASDGIKLHVDHIMPVSKGGKSVESNLRTLCQSCNIGKGAKYDQHGMN